MLGHAKNQVNHMICSNNIASICDVTLNTFPQHDSVVPSYSLYGTDTFKRLLLRSRQSGNQQRNDPKRVGSLANQCSRRSSSCHGCFCFCPEWQDPRD